MEIRSCRASDTVIKRFDNVKFTKEDAHKPTDQRTIEFNEFRKQNRGMLKILGDWSMNHIWDKRQELILSGKCSYRELGDLVIRRFYEFAGVEFPSWLGEWIKDLTLEELEINEKDVIIGIFRELTHRSLSQARGAGLIDPKDDSYYQTTEMRVIKCLQNELWSFVRKGYHDKYLIDNSILSLFKDRLPELTLKKLGEIMNIEYWRNRNGMRLRCTQAELSKFIVGEIDESEDI